MVMQIIEVSSIANFPMITMRQEDFFLAFQEKTPEYVFKIQYEDGSDYYWRFYPFMGGFFVNILGDQSETWEEFVEVIDKWVALGFSTKKQYLNALEYGIPNFEGYNEFINSDFLNEYNERKDPRYFAHRLEYHSDKTKNGVYKLFQDYSKSKFKHARAFLVASETGIKSVKEYNDFLSSGYAATDYEGILEPDTRVYDHYKKFKKSGFKERADFLQAQDLGFTKPKQYYEFKNGGYSSVEEYQWAKEKMPKLIKTLNKNNDSIRKESEDLLKNGFYSNAFTTHFILLEKKIEESYLKHEKCEYPKNYAHGECIDELSSHCDDLDINEFHKWRILRNKITHDHQKIEKDEAEKGILYLGQTIHQLGKCFP